MSIADEAGRVTLPAVRYRFFRRRLFLGGGTAEKVAEVRSAGSIGAALTVVFTLTLPDDVRAVFVRMRTVPPRLVAL